MTAVFQSTTVASEYRGKRTRGKADLSERVAKRTTIGRKDCDFDDDIWMEISYDDENCPDSPTSHLYEAFGHQWYLLECDLGPKQFPLMPSLGAPDSEVEQRRLDVISCYWEAAHKWKISQETVEMAFNVWGKLLSHHKDTNPTSPRPLSCKTFALTTATALRIATKFNERLELTWELPKSPWDMLTVFDGWPIDRSSESLIQAECASLSVLGDCMDQPSTIKMFDRLLRVGEWPTEVALEIKSLGRYLLALSQFSHGHGHLREDLEPSKLAAAALALAVKITNLARPEYAQYEFFPSRLEVYTGFTFNDIQPVVRRISTLLRCKPVQADILAEVFPVWGRHEWM
eukprot:Lankesteria_metandrocarpae@DN282_c0_g1_i1.p1